MLIFLMILNIYYYEFHLIYYRNCKYYKFKNTLKTTTFMYLTVCINFNFIICKFIIEKYYTVITKVKYIA